MQNYPLNEETVPGAQSPATLPLTPPPPPPDSLFYPRKPRRFLWVIALFGTLILGYIAGVSTYPLLVSASKLIPVQTTSTHLSSQATTSPTPIPTPTFTPTPTKELKWTVTHTFSGKDTQNTDYFILDKDWKFFWTCDPATIPGAYNVIVTLYDENAQYLQLLLNTVCQPGTTNGEMLVHQGQQQKVFLKIEIAGKWTVKVQEMR